MDLEVAARGFTWVVRPHAEGLVVASAGRKCDRGGRRRGRERLHIGERDLNILDEACMLRCVQKKIGRSSEERFVTEYFTKIASHVGLHV